MKFIKTITTSFQYGLVFSAVRSEIKSALEGATGAIPSYTVGGVRVEELEAPLFSFPNAAAYLDGENTGIKITRGMAHCKTLLSAVLAHEEGHVLCRAFPGVDGLSVQEAELIADQYMIKTCTRKEVMTVLALLEIMNPLYKQAGDLESYFCNLQRINKLREYILS